jgi:Cysteine dioxygenase type I
VTTLDVPTRTLDPAELGAVAGRLASFANRWSAMASPHPDRRWFRQLHRDDVHDVWLLGWDQAQGIELHDHGGSAGAFCVVTGRLLEASTDRVTRRRVERERVGLGDVRAFDADHVHDLVNPGPGAAVSIHVYSPPLRAMTFYDDAPGTFLTPVRTEAADSPAGGGVA